MALYLVIASATQLVEADSAEEAKSEVVSFDWEFEIEDVQEYEECSDHVLRPKEKD